MTTELKDGLGNEFSVVTKDVSPLKNNSVRQNWHLSTKYPVEHRSGGAFQTSMRSNVMTSPVAANAPIAAFRFVSPSLICLLRSLDFSMWSVSAFTSPGLLSFDAFVARLYTAEDTNGLSAALSGNVGKLRTIHQTALANLIVANTVPITVGTRVLDAHPFANIIATSPSALNNTVYFNNEELFKERDHPMVLENQEGVVIQASVPAGSWGFTVTAAWDEIEANVY